MRYFNLFREAREATGLKQHELADRLQMSISSIRQWEAEPKPEEARQLAQLVREAGRRDYERELLVLAGEKPVGTPTNIEDLTGEERQLVEWAITTYRKLHSAAQQGALQFVGGLQNLVEVAEDSIPAPVARLSREDLDLLIVFLEKTDAMRIVASAVTGGNPESVFATSEDSPVRKDKEDMPEPRKKRV